MKNRIFALAIVLILTLALSVPALAAVAHNPNSSPPPANSTTQKPAAPSASAVTFKSQHGTVTLSEVSKTEKTTLKFASESKSVTVYFVPSTCVLTNSGAADVLTYKKTSEGYYSIEGYVQGSSVTLSPAFDLIEINFGAEYYYLMKYTGTSSTTTKSTPSPSASRQATPAPSAPSDKNTVKVAGQNRTLGQIQTHSSGGYLYTVDRGDTLYDLAKRFYGSGNLWKELQKSNQKWLNETKDGTIFVGFNLLLPVELGGVRVNVG